MSVAFYAVMTTACGLLWCHVFFWTPLPVSEFPLKFWILAAAAMFSNICYCFGLEGAYRRMDMSAAYPVVRSLPILMTAAVTCLFGIGRMLSPTAILGMFVVFVGCAVMPLAKFSDFNIRNYWNVNMLFLLISACGITGYTILDSQAQQQLLPAAEALDVSRTVVSMTYYSVREVLLASSFTLTALCLPGERRLWTGLIKDVKVTPVLAGFFDSLSYVAVLIAMNYVDNVSYVQVFRQIGLVFGLLAGVIVLKEKCTLTKIVGVVFILTGLVMTVL